MLDGARSIALPTKFGQNLIVKKTSGNQLIWRSFDYKNSCWFEAVFSLPNLKLISSTYQSKQEGSSEIIAETLQGILIEAKKLNTDFLNSSEGASVETKLSFPRDWGLGSSSTLINSIASWARINPYHLLQNAFSGSGYDIACAQHDFPILYQLVQKEPLLKKVDFKPSFSDQLFFVYLNRKQNSREGINRYNERRSKLNNEITRISEISDALLKAKDVNEFSELIKEHEQIISQVIELPTVKDSLFKDFKGTIKSLGAWGGDFILAIGGEKTQDYFKWKGYQTTVPYSSMVL